MYTRWYYVIIVLVNTGLRISEFLGLTFNDIDFENNIISVDHQITCYYSKNCRFEHQREVSLKVVPPKTATGVRMVALNQEAREALEWLIQNRVKVETEPVVDGYTGFIFLNAVGRPTRTANVDSSFKNMINSYNKIHEDEEQLPPITPHYFRHTFCTKMADKGMNPKHLQYIMGHASNRMTSRYTHPNASAAVEAMKELGRNSSDS